MLRTNHTYRETLEEIESLLLFKIPKSQRPKDVRQINNVKAMENYFKRVEVDHSDLKYIHIAGTKGKGSTSTFCESILRSQGLKTGLFTSPHLIDVRERIKLNGEPISKERFVELFWRLYEKLDNTKDDMFPSKATYFRMLMLMAVTFFQEENVDVAIMEVGLGGRLDSTNILNPVVSAITSIGLDHTEILGDTYVKIAAEKAGIIKKDVPVISYTQKEGVMDVFKDFAKEKKTHLILTPSFSEYFEEQDKETQSQIHLEMMGTHQEKNAAMALTICKVFNQIKNDEFDPSILIERDPKVLKEENRIEEIGVKVFPPEKITKDEIKGINCTRLEGRGHSVHLEKKNLNFYLDGAHTVESINFANAWFHQIMDLEEKGGKVPKGWLLETNGDKEKMIASFQKKLKKAKKHNDLDKARNNILVFNYTGNRNPAELLSPFWKEENMFDYVVFVPLDSSKESLLKSKHSMLKDKKRLNMLKKVWNEHDQSNTEVKLFKSIEDLSVWLWNKKEESSASVFITGSMYMVGDFLNRLNNLNSLL